MGVGFRGWGGVGSFGVGGLGVGEGTHFFLHSDEVLNCAEEWFDVELPGDEELCTMHCASVTLQS